MQTFVLFNPQWQGGADPITYHGAKELQALYFPETSYVEAPVSLENTLNKKNGIIGYDILREQMTQVSEILKAEAFHRIFAIGGGCDGDVPVIAHLSQKYNDLMVIWLDAHGDLNSPSESETGLFYGMPARVLMGECSVFEEIIEVPLSPSRFLHIGGRDFDQPETDYLKKNNIYYSQSLQINEVLARVENHPVYVHLDLDAVNPDEFPNTPLPVPNGLKRQDVLELLTKLSHLPNFVGLGLYEYAPCGQKDAFIQSIVDLLIRK